MPSRRSVAFLLVVFVVLTWIVPQDVRGQVPQTISHQGILTDAEGNSVSDGTYTLTFTLYDAAMGGNALWTEAQEVQVTGGVFSVTLGSVTPLELPFDQPYWLGMAVGEEDELRPRMALTAAPYSLGARATVTEPEPGSSFAIRTEDGGTAHVLSPDGNARHAGQGMFEGGLVVPGDTAAGKVVVVPEVGTQSEGTQTGVFGKSEEGQGVTGQSTSGVGVFGVSEEAEGVLGESTSGRGVAGTSETFYGVQGQSESSIGVFAISEEGPGLVARGNPAGRFNGNVELKDVEEDPDQERVLVWSNDDVVRWRTLPEGGDGGSSAWAVDADGNLVASGQDVIIQDGEGNVTTRFEADGTSLHTGHEKFLGGITLTDEADETGVMINEFGVFVFDEEGNFASSLTRDGSTHNLDETFTADVILEGPGIKLVDENGETLAGFGREDLDTGQRLGVYGRAEEEGDLAGAFDGDVDVNGEVFANSFHLVTEEETQPIHNFNADGTVEMTGPVRIERDTPQAPQTALQVSNVPIPGNTLLNPATALFAGRLFNIPTLALYGFNSVTSAFSPAQFFYPDGRARIFGDLIVDGQFNVLGESFHDALETYAVGLLATGFHTVGDIGFGFRFERPPAEAMLKQDQQTHIGVAVFDPNVGSTTTGVQSEVRGTGSAVLGVKAEGGSAAPRYVADTGMLAGGAGENQTLGPPSLGPGKAQGGNPVIWGASLMDNVTAVLGQNLLQTSTDPAVWGVTAGSGAAVRAQTTGAGNALEVDHQGNAGNIAVFQSGSTNQARIDKTGTGFFNGGTQNSGADLAEAFEVEGSVASYEPGDVLVISTRSDRTMERSTEAYSTRVVGVYATKPGVLLTERDLDADHSDTVPVGVVGVIPTKVTAENGPIRRGDLLVTSSTPGHAQKADPDELGFGMVLGKALENFDGPGTGLIEVLVNVK